MLLNFNTQAGKLANKSGKRIVAPFLPNSARATVERDCRTNGRRVHKKIDNLSSGIITRPPLMCVVVAVVFLFSASAATFVVVVRQLSNGNTYKFTEWRYSFGIFILTI